MSESSQADRYLLRQIAAGDQNGWAQLVARYHGRLLAFARQQLRNAADADDVVQETFVQFLQQRGRFDPNRSLETFLFTILRRRIIDTFRGRSARVCLLHETTYGPDRDARRSSLDLSVSSYARRNEQAERDHAALSAALGQLVERFRAGERFRDLQVMEMLFYAQMRNGDVARLAGMDEKAVALLKHRWLKELAAGIGAQAEANESLSDSLLTEVWEELRPTCPKRSTVGRMLLGTLEGPWAEYVSFHVRMLGCRFCQANLADLQPAPEQATRSAYERLYQSTVGFLRRV